MQHRHSPVYFSRVLGLSLTSLLTVTSVHASTAEKSTTEQAGDVLMVGIPLTALGMALAKEDQEGVKQLGYSMATNVVATYGLKQAFADTQWGTRPNGEEQSFPSGHASVACTGATFIGQRYGWKYGSMAMVPAGYVAWSRVDADKHYPRDVLIGCAIGVISGLYWTTPEDSTHIIPWYENKTLGVTIQSTW